MEKIVFVSREPGNREQLIALMEALFPECRVEVVTVTGGESNLMNDLLEKNIGSDGRRFSS